MTLSTTNVPIRKRRLLLTNNSTEGDFAALADLAAAPVAIDESGDPSANYAVIACNGASILDLEFFGTDAANEIFNVRVYGYHQYLGEDLTDYTPHLLADLTCTIGALTGRAGTGGIGSSNLYVDTIVAAALGVRSNVAIFSPANDNKASVRIGLNGESYVMVQFDMNTAASGNGNYALL